MKPEEINEIKQSGEVLAIKEAIGKRAFKAKKLLEEIGYNDWQDVDKNIAEVELLIEEIKQLWSSK